MRTGGSVRLFGTGRSHDPDEEVTYHWSQVSGTTVTLSPSANSATFTAPATPGELVFRLTVTDERSVSASDDVTITVVANRAPTANAGGNQTVDTGDRVFLIGSGSDPDSGETLTYSWTQIGTPAVTLSNAASATAYFTAPSSAATLTFRLTVSDGSLSGTDDVTVTVQQSLNFSALPGHGEPIDYLDRSYGSIHTLTDFNGAALNAVSAFTGVDTATQRGMFGINGPLIPNVVGQSVTDIPFFSMWVEEHTLTSSQGVVNWHKRLRIRIYNSSAIIPDWTVEGSGWDFVVEFQPVGGAWQEVLTDNNEDLLDVGFTSATRPIAFIQLQDTFLPQAEYDAFKSFFMADALSKYNIRIRVALD